jgi:hypothetical protein
MREKGWERESKKNGPKSVDQNPLTNAWPQWAAMAF